MKLTLSTSFFYAAVAVMSSTAARAAAPDNCITHDLTFVVKEGSSQMKAVEDDIRQDLEKIGINLEVIFANSTEYDVYETEGDYNLLFATTWGAPYDPIPSKHTISQEESLRP